MPYHGISFSDYSMEDLMGDEEHWRSLEPACMDLVRGIASNRAVSITPQIMYLAMLQDATSIWYERVYCESNQADALSRTDSLAQDLCTKVVTLTSTADAQKLASGSTSTMTLGGAKAAQRDVGELLPE